MNRSIRSGFSALIDIGRLEHRSRRRLAAGFLAAIFFHAALGLIVMLNYHPAHKTPRPEPERLIRTDLIEIPRLPDEPLHITEHRFVKKELRRPGFIPTVPGDVPSGKALPEPDTKPPELRVDTGREIGRISDRLSDGPSLDAAVPRAPDIRIPLRRDAGPDPGMFKSDIIYRPEDKFAAQGYVHIPLIRSGGFTQTETYIRSLRGLVEGINRHTNIRAVFDNPYDRISWRNNTRGFPMIDEISPERGIPLKTVYVYRPPVVYLLIDREIKLSEEEKGSVSRYINSGGIVFIESARPGDPVLREFLRGFARTLYSGVVPIERIPDDHPIYHVFHDFSGGAPEGAGQNLGAVTHRVQPYLEAVMSAGRLITVFSDKGYGLSWAAEEYDSPSMKMGVNLVLYALVQQKEKPGHRALARE